jgi:hypothetical protein
MTDIVYFFVTIFVTLVFTLISDKYLFANNAVHKRLLSEYRQIANAQIDNINEARLKCIQNLSTKNPYWHVLIKFEESFDYPVPTHFNERLLGEIYRIRESVIAEKNDAILEIEAIRGLKFN